MKNPKLAKSIKTIVNNMVAAIIPEFEKQIRLQVKALPGLIAASLTEAPKGKKVAKAAKKEKAVKTAGGSPLKGRKRNMTCKAEGCRAKSKGPRFSFLCEAHLGSKKTKVKAKKEKAVKPAKKLRHTKIEELMAKKTAPPTPVVAAPAVEAAPAPAPVAATPANGTPAVL